MTNTPLSDNEKIKILQEAARFGGQPMTNTNREEWEVVAEAVRDAAYRLAQTFGMGSLSVANLDRAATLIENQGREIERYREALTEIERISKRQFGGHWGIGEHARTALQSPTQAPLQEGEPQT